MKICVLNGSPKGSDSVTMQYVRFLELAFPGHTFIVEHVGQRITALEMDEEAFRKVMASISSADAILFATPVYYMLVPAQFKRFFELLFTKNAKSDFTGKYAAAITTSIHFFDQTATAYLHAVAEDLGMLWGGPFMAKMNDLTSEKHQEELLLFGADFFDQASRRPAVQRFYPPVNRTLYQYRPGGIPMPLDTAGKKAVILTDARPGSNLEKMVTRAASCFGTAALVIPLEDAEMKGGCLGCCRCAFENRCVYTDGFVNFWNTTVLGADIVIFAGYVKDRYLSADFKQVFDRSFFKGHVPSLAGRPVGFIIEGPFSQCETLREVLTSYVAVQGSTLAGFVSDEDENSTAIDARIDTLADRALRLAKSGYVAPGGFPSVAGKKVFRDELYAGMRAVFKADDAYYQQHGLYDFPTDHLGDRVRTTSLSLLLSIPQARKSTEQDMKKHMLEPLEQAIRTSPVLKRRQQEQKR
ncbi:MAG: hypothetical protein GYA23_09550 [Methanomicrobiales archaeon]|nr:hypothetical protein [Methanomicrobiales archaeon]